MAMSNKGLTKLIEECGELVQIASKKIAYLETDNHPDGMGSMKVRLEQEMADVMATIAFVTEKLELDESTMFTRGNEKMQLYKKWDK